MRPAMTKAARFGPGPLVLAGLAVGVAASLCLGALIVGAPAASAATVGQAEIVSPGSTEPLTTGGSATQFGVLLPANARCPGDSTKRPWWRASSYLLPAGTSPRTVNFRGLLPDRGLFLAAFGAPWEHQNVDKGSGIVLLPAAFDISRWGPSQLFAGGAREATWDGGIACVADATGQVATYWGARFTFVRSTTDPRGFTWATTPPAHLGSSGGGSHWLVEIGLALLVLAGLIGLKLTSPRRRRRDGRPPVPGGPETRGQAEARR